MKAAIIGSRGLKAINIGEYIPEGTDEIISGGARGIDTCAAEYARAHGIKLTEIFPDYKRYGRAAPIVRNREIIERSDIVIALWDGRSRGTAHVVSECERLEHPVRVFIIASE